MTRLMDKEKETFPKQFEGQAVIVVENGVVVEIGKTSMFHPEIKFIKRDGICWLEDKIRKEG